MFHTALFEAKSWHGLRLAVETNAKPVHSFEPLSDLCGSGKLRATAQRCCTLLQMRRCVYGRSPLPCPGATPRLEAIG